MRQMIVTESDWKKREEERRRASKGDLAAWESLFTWLCRWSVRTAGGDDAAQDGWLKIVRDPELWLKDLPVFVILFKRKGLDVGRTARRQARRLAALLADGAGSIQARSTPDLKEDIRRALARLPDDKRFLVDLFLEGRSFKEIAELVASDYQKVRRQLRKALQDLQKILENWLWAAVAASPVAGRSQLSQGGHHGKEGTNGLDGGA